MRLLGLACLALAAAGPVYAQAPPNIVLITADDVGQGDLGVYGRPVETPNLDRLANEGIRFNQFYVTTSSCSPSRASFWTGKYPHATGAENLHDPLPAGEVTIAGYLRDRGYYTGNVGKLHLGERPAVLGQFDVLIDEVFGPDAAATDPGGIDEFLDRRPQGRPFFLGIGYTEAHRPFGHRSPIPHPHDPSEVWVPPYLPDVPEIRQELVQYYDEINFMDASIGRLMARLRREELERDTLVLFFGDNGMPFPRAKTTLYESGVRVPFLAKWPRRIEGGSVSDALASSVDIAPTLLELAGIPLPEHMQGRSMMAALMDPSAPAREYVFVERNWHNFDDHARAVRWKHLKYHRNWFPGEPYYLASDLMDNPSFAAMLRLLDRGQLTPQQTILFHAVRPVEALYDLRSDPFEFENLAHRSEYQEALAHLRRALEAWVVETHDSDPEERNYDNIINRTGERLYPDRGLPRQPVDFGALKTRQREEEVRKNRPIP